MSENVLGIKMIGHDTGAAVISNGRVIAISEERLNRIKHSLNMFPHKSIAYCLEALSLKPEDIHLILIDRIRAPEERGTPEELFKARSIVAFPKAKIVTVNHQEAHAASTFFASPFEDAGILVYDGFGEDFISHTGVKVVESDTLFFGKGNHFTQIAKTAHRVKGRDFPYTTGIGMLYSKISQKYIRLGKFNEGKMMGLASYGNDSILKMFPPERWFRDYMGSIVVNARIAFARPNFRQLMRNAKSWRARIRFFYYWLTGFASIPWSVFRRWRSKNELFPELRLPRPRRHPKIDKLPDDYYASVAYAVQKVLEIVCLSWAKKLFAVTQSQNIAIAGGVGLNIDANKKILDESGFKHIFIQPGATDCGIPLGLALYGLHMVLGEPRFFKMQGAALGRPYTETEIQKALSRFSDKITYKKSATSVHDAAAEIARGKIIGWFTGGSEYGPRALGHRSILCDARNKDMKDIVNARVKHREAWRPFAASVLLEDMGRYFDLKEESPFMILCADVHKNMRTKIPSVVHVDGTCRIQTVTRESNARYHELLSEFKKLTGESIVLNTSFNLGGDPIVETPEDALDSFLRTDIDCLVIEDYIIRKK
ncbi:MAG TPA: carbamoyltransferase C-terminal domain-containing protein [Candidatus Paceibacterota bacterium]